MTQTTTPPDVRQLQSENLASARFPGGGPEFRVFIAPEAHEKMRAHAGANTEVEVCGVMVGDWRRDESGPYVQVVDAIAGEAAESKQAEVTFTHQTWTKINQEMDQKHQDKKIVGWYHTHPDFGVFLSDRDRFIHEHFFATAGQIAYVIDPIRKQEGVFRWSQGQPVLCDLFWVGDRTVQKPAEESRSSLSSATSANPAPSPSPPAQEPSMARWAGELALKLLVLAAMLMLGYVAGSQLSLAERQRAMVMMASMGSLRPGLTELVEVIERDLEAQDRVAAELAERHVKLVTDKAESEKVSRSWREYREATASNRARLSLLRQVFGLSREETALLKWMNDERNRVIDQAAVGDLTGEGSRRERGASQGVPPLLSRERINEAPATQPVEGVNESR